MRYVCEYSGVTRVIEAANMKAATEEMLFIVTGIRNFVTGHPVKAWPVLTDEIKTAVAEVRREVDYENAIETEDEGIGSPTLTHYTEVLLNLLETLWLNR